MTDGGGRYGLGLEAGGSLDVRGVELEPIGSLDPAVENWTNFFH